MQLHMSIAEKPSSSPDIEGSEVDSQKRGAGLHMLLFLCTCNLWLTSHSAIPFLMFLCTREMVFLGCRSSPSAGWWHAAAPAWLPPCWCQCCACRTGWKCHAAWWWLWTAACSSSTTTGACSCASTCARPLVRAHCVLVLECRMPSCHGACCLYLVCVSCVDQTSRHTFNLGTSPCLQDTHAVSICMHAFKTPHAQPPVLIFSQPPTCWFVGCYCAAGSRCRELLHLLEFTPVADGSSFGAAVIAAAAAHS